MKPDRAFVEELRRSLPASVSERLDLAIEKLVDAKRRNGRVVVVTGSGPNVHEGVTTLIAELIHKGIVDGVITSSAVVSHEMAGTLDRVKRIPISEDDGIELPKALLPRGDVFEITMLADSDRSQIEKEIEQGWELYDLLQNKPGEVIIKAAGNMAWPMGLRTEQLALAAGNAVRRSDTPLEQIAGLGADPRTMIGAAAQRNVPVLVSIPQLVGGGAVGLTIGDAISISARARRIADLLSGADVIVESAIALSQEIHDGPFETYTGHGIWAGWGGSPTFSLEEKTLIRIDLDPNLERAWHEERQGSQVQQAVDRGLPKTKLTGIPFRMEMSGFARLEGSIPVTADIGVVWPVIACGLEDALGIELDFISAPQESEAGKRMREWIVESVRFADWERTLSSHGRVRSPMQA